MGTMRRNGASIIAFPVPVGAINPVDRRLQTCNPISLTGCLDPITRENTGQSGACKVHMGDYAERGDSRTVLDDLRQMWHMKNDHLARHDAAAATAFEANHPLPPVVSGECRVIVLHSVACVYV